MDHFTDTPHDITLTPAAIEAHDRERERINDSIEVFARAYARDCGEPLPEQWYFDHWERYAGRLHVHFSYSDQSGGEQRSIKFPILALTDPVERNAAVEGRRADIAIKKQAEKEAADERDRSELARITARMAARA